MPVALDLVDGVVISQMAEAEMTANAPGETSDHDGGQETYVPRGQPSGRRIAVAQCESAHAFSRRQPPSSGDRRERVYSLRGGVMAMRQHGRPPMAIVASILMAASLGGDPAIGSESISLAQAGGEPKAMRIVTKFQQDAVFHLAWSPDGRYLAAASGAAKGYTIWDPKTGRKLRELRDPYGPYAGEGALAFTPDGKHLIVLPRYPVTVEGRRIGFALWNVETGGIDRQVEAPFTGPPPAYATVMHYAVSVAAERLAVAYTGRNAPRHIVIYDTRTWQIVNTKVPVPTPIYPPPAFAYAPAGDLIAMGGARPGEYRGIPTGVIWIYEVATGKLLRTVEQAHAHYVRHLKFGSGGEMLASAPPPGLFQHRNAATGNLEELREEDSIRVWSTTSARKLNSFTGDFAGSFCLDFNSKKPLLVTGNGTRTKSDAAPFRLWDVHSGRLVATFGNFSEGGPRVASFSPDGQRLAMAGADEGGPEYVFIAEISGTQGN